MYNTGLTLTPATPSENMFTTTEWSPKPQQTTRTAAIRNQEMQKKGKGAYSSVVKPIQDPLRPGPSGPDAAVVVADTSPVLTRVLSDLSSSTTMLLRATKRSITSGSLPGRPKAPKICRRCIRYEGVGRKGADHICTRRPGSSKCE